jgi:hypothetical protein
MKYAILLLLFISFISLSSKVETKVVEVEVIRIDTVHVLVPTELDIYLLAKMIESEASRSTKGVERITGRIMAGNVAVNRLKNDILGGKLRTLTKIIHKKNQFHGVKTSRFKEKPSKESLISATIAALDLNLLPIEVEYFNTADAPNIWNKRNLKEWAYIARHSFRYKAR